jgi:hypothetical protein
VAQADDSFTTSKLLPIPLPQMVVEDLPNVRKEAAQRIDRLIQFLDATDPYVSAELEEENEHGDGDADDEPSLGASEIANQERGWSYKHNPTKDDCEDQNEDGDELDTLEASDLEISGEADGDNGGCVDDEPEQEGPALCKAVQ